MNEFQMTLQLLDRKGRMVTELGWPFRSLSLDMALVYGGDVAAHHMDEHRILRRIAPVHGFRVLVEQPLHR